MIPLDGRKADLSGDREIFQGMIYDFLCWTVLHYRTTWLYRKHRLPFPLYRIVRALIALRPSLHIRLLESRWHCSLQVFLLCFPHVRQPAPNAPELASSLISAVKVKAVVPLFMETSHHERGQRTRSVSQNLRLQ